MYKYIRNLAEQLQDAKDLDLGELKFEAAVEKEGGTEKGGSDGAESQEIAEKAESGADLSPSKLRCALIITSMSMVAHMDLHVYNWLVVCTIGVQCV